MIMATILKPDPERKDFNDNRVQDAGQEFEPTTRDTHMMRTPLVIPEPRRPSPVVISRPSSPGRVADRTSPSSSPSLSPDAHGLRHLPWTTPLYPCFPHPLHFFPYRVPGLPISTFHDHFGLSSFPERLGMFAHHNPAALSSFTFQGAISPYIFPQSSVPEKSIGLETRNIENEINVMNGSAFDLVKPKDIVNEPEVRQEKSSSRTASERSEPSRSPERKRQKTEDQPKYKCGNCQKNYSTFSGLSKHKQFHCEQDAQKEFTCKYCDKTYVSLGALKMHIRTHTLPCKCKICGKAFSRPWLLQGHIRTHTGEKPFSCVHCLRAFADRSNLRAHLQTHSDVKKYSCKTCSKTFSRMSLLLKHEDSCNCMDA